jgi:hypothetical protein
MKNLLLIFIKINKKELQIGRKKIREIEIEIEIQAHLLKQRNENEK